ncbi:uncharacterized protein LOC118437129 [Folsomia candida]|uniref:uncharacterized protein LOC118437129 n=1 Tax=Folsomia candida TaxID=158441 RepID=UPI001604AFEF|nr:uncharacterized protein LOC118437129 [Folsomia candida]
MKPTREKPVAFFSAAWIAYYSLGLCSLHLVREVGSIPQGYGQEEESKRECNSRLDDTCQTLAQAEHCGTTPYCINCVWNTALVPKDDIDKCRMCKDEMIAGSRRKDKLKSVLEYVCKFHEDQEDVDACMELVQDRDSSGLLGEIINRNMTAHDVCGLLALCWVLFEVWVTNVDTSSSFESSAAAVLSESRGPVAMGGFRFR